MQNVLILYMRCNTRAFENNLRVIFEMCRGTPEDTSVFVNLVESCTISPIFSSQVTYLCTYVATQLQMYTCMSTRMQCTMLGGELYVCSYVFFSNFIATSTLLFKLYKIPYSRKVWQISVL